MLKAETTNTQKWRKKTKKIWIRTWKTKILSSKAEERKEIFVATLRSLDMSTKLFAFNALNADPQITPKGILFFFFCCKKKDKGMT